MHLSVSGTTAVAGQRASRGTMAALSPYSDNILLQNKPVCQNHRHYKSASWQTGRREKQKFRTSCILILLILLFQTANQHLQASQILPELPMPHVFHVLKHRWHVWHDLDHRWL